MPSLTTNDKTNDKEIARNPHPPCGLGRDAGISRPCQVKSMLICPRNRSEQSEQTVGGSMCFSSSFDVEGKA